MKFQVVCYRSGKAYYIDAVPLRSIYLWKDGTLNKRSTGYIEAGRPDEMSIALGYWRTKQEAQQFLDNWIPQEKQLSIEQIKQAAELDEKTALNFSIEHWKQNVLDVENAHLGGSYCAVCERAGNERVLGDVSRCKYCIVNNYKWVIFNCCKEYDDFCSSKTEENAIVMLNKLVLIRNNKYGNPYIVEEKKMANIEFDDGVKVELSKETTERLRKELVKPKVEWRHGDIALSHWYDVPKKRLILIEGEEIKIYDNTGYQLYRSYSQKYIKDKMEEYKYERIGNLFDDLSK